MSVRCRPGVWCEAECRSRRSVTFRGLCWARHWFPKCQASEARIRPASTHTHRLEGAEMPQCERATAPATVV